ncbi:hypothetical protein ACFLRY_03855 [Bacteroidota bacterium]
MRKIYLIIILLFFSFWAHSQIIDSFPRIQEDYFLKLTELLENTNNKNRQEEARDILNNFSEHWNSNYFNKSMRTKVYDLSDMMKTKRMYTYPHFFNFISCLNAMSEERLSKASFNAWAIKMQEEGHGRKSVEIEDWLKYSIGFFKEDLLNKERSRNWHFHEAKYRFENDTAFIIVFDKLNLYCNTKNDSSVIFETKGHYNPGLKKWTGLGGKIYWSRVELAEEIHAELKNYSINTSLIRFYADSVVLHDKKFFRKSMLGSLEEVIQSGPTSKKSSYPRFVSYFRDYYLEDVFKGVSLEGGIEIHGSRLIISGSKYKNAHMEIVNGHNVKTFFKSPEFIVFDNEISSLSTSFSVIFNGDSLYHPKVKMMYEADKRLITQYQVYDTRIIPYYDSYHKMDIYSEALYWNLDSSFISFKSMMGFNQKSQVIFESDSYFSENDYYKLQGLDDRNPLVVLRNYSRSFGTDIVKPALLAEYMKIPEEQAISNLLLLESKGFIVYDVDRREAKIKKRTFDFLEARAGTRDYDVVKFESNTKFESNANLNLDNFDLNINGVDEIFLSNPQKVFIFPKDGEIAMKENRDFTFKGKVQAGLFNFYSGECSFEYDTFRINLPSIDSISIFVNRLKSDKKEDSEGGEGEEKEEEVLDQKELSDQLVEEDVQEIVKLHSVIEGLSGYILIDKFNNKSGLQSYPDYPIFNSISSSYVYYDAHGIRNGVYDRGDFYYQLDPFVIDSLDNFSTDGIFFTGYLASSDIFPSITKPLRIMKDYYLGFETKTPAEGFPVYNDKGNYFRDISLKGDGLTGEGQFDYINSISQSNSFVFYPDSLTYRAEDFDNLEAMAPVEIPGIKSKVVDAIFLPETNKLEVSDIDNPFKMYESAKFSGLMTLSPDSTYGNGDFKFEKASIESPIFNFKHHSLNSDTSDFTIYTDTNFVNLAFDAQNYQSMMDFDLRKGEFYSNGINSLMEFPFNQYVCNMDGFEWVMDENQMYLRNRLIGDLDDYENLSEEQLIDIELTGSEFTSVHPDQDSLKFFAVKARYDINNNIINTEGVEIIKVADAAIFPRDGVIIILKDAKLETILGANIIADTANKFHKIYGANVNIFSRKNYVAKGFYDYYDRDSIPETIKFSTVSVDEDGQTYALASVTQADEFMLSPRFNYDGRILMSAKIQNLKFTGGFSPIQDCYNRPMEFVFFDTVVDPFNIVLPISDSIFSVNKEELSLSINYSRIDKRFYPSFFSRKWNQTDSEVLSAKGYMNYNYDGKYYLLSENLNVLDSNLNHNYFQLNTHNCRINSRGPLNLAVEYPYLHLNTFGLLNYYIVPDSLKIKATIGMDFFLDGEIMKIFTDELKEAILRSVDLPTTTYLGYLYEKLNDEESEKVMEEIGLYGTSRRVPQDIRQTILLADVNMSWNPETKSYVSKGDIGVASVDNTPINKYFKGYLEFEMREFSPVMTLYIEISDNNWYYFSYRNNIMQTISSDEKFNDLVINLKPERRIFEDREEESPYEFVISSKRKRIEFLRKMQKANR